MARTSDITSLTDCRQNFRAHLNRVKRTGRPLFITTNGQAEAVILSAKAYDELADQADLEGILADIERSEADIRAGRVRTPDESRRATAKKLGITLRK
jgi:prevent-host-death family protein